MRRRSPLLLALMLGVGLPLQALSQASEPASPPLGWELARAAVEAAHAEAARNGWAVTVVVADAEGIPILLGRMDGASTRSVEFALGKARTSALSGLSTLEVSERLAAGLGVADVPDPVPIEGGYPVVVDGRVVGAIAASGVPPQQDAIVARAGLAVLSGP